MARQPQFNEPATIVLQFRVTPTQRRDLEDVARQNHTTISEALREAANEYVADFRDAPVFAGNRSTHQKS